MIFIRNKKGHDLKIQGAPLPEMETLPAPRTVAALPERIPFIKPRLKVGKGDRVKIGSVLYEDKKNPDLIFLSPGGGGVEDIRFGPRRVIEEIVIALDKQEEALSFEALDNRQLDGIDREDLVRLILDGGLWALLRSLPFRDIAPPTEIPPAIIVTLDTREPFQPLPAVYLAGETEMFDFGIRVLRKLAENRVWISAAPGNSFIDRDLKGVITHTIKGPYPAQDPGVLLYRAKRTADENRAWYIKGQDVLLLARLIRNGRYPTSRVAAVGGSSAARRRHLKTRLGVPLAQLTLGSADNGGARFIVGGIWHGYAGSSQSHLGLYETSLTLLPEGDHKEFMALFNPGFGKPSYSRAFLSRMNPARLEFNCNRHGGRRACIACMHCADVCPVDILPQLAYKAVLAQEVEESLQHGLLDCVECGLCSYVCPSKIELTAALKKARAAYRKEQQG